MENHHIWCNYLKGPRDQCKFCQRLSERYPEKADDPLGIDLMKEHFPNNVIRSTDEIVQRRPSRHGRRPW